MINITNQENIKHIKLARKRLRENTSKCFICGRPNVKLCNSHSIPQFILKEIDEEGKIDTATGVHLKNYKVDTSNKVFRRGKIK